VKKQKSAKKLRLAKETLAALDPEKLEPVAGHVAGYCPVESAEICSEVHTCVSCRTTWA
jgi:hypothetical protein